MRPILSRCEDTAVWSWRVQIRFFVCGAGWKAKSTKKNKHKRRIGRSHYEQCCPHKACMPRRPQESYTYYCQESWKMHWIRWWDFWTLKL